EHVDDLGDDLVRLEVARKPERSRRAEDAGYAAARLARDAERDPALRQHGDRLDARAVAQFERVLDRVAARRLDLLVDPRQAEVDQPGQLLALRLPQVRHRGRIARALAVDPFEHLPGPVTLPARA